MDSNKQSALYQKCRGVGLAVALGLASLAWLAGYLALLTAACYAAYELRLLDRVRHLMAHMRDSGCDPVEM